jgi:hypothetical protein
MSKQKASPPPAEILRTIEARSKRVNELATQLSKRIESFEAWLNQLPGRVETKLWVSESPGSLESFGLRLHRAGKRWIISYGWWHEEISDPEDDPWSPLTDASIEVKMRALQLFPKLLEQIAAAQVETADRIEAAQAAFDEFARVIGAIGKEGA